MALPPNVQIISQPGMENIRQFQKLKHKVYINEHQVEARPSTSDEPDLARESYFLAIDRNTNHVIGGICVTTLPKNNEAMLPFQRMEEFDNWAQLLPNYNLHYYNRSQLSSIAVDIKDPDLKRAVKMELMTRAIDHAFAAKHSDVVLTIPQTVIFPEADKKPEPDPAANEVCIRDVIRERELDVPSDAQDPLNDYAVATKGQCYLLSGGKHSSATPPPYARTLYAISQNPKLSLGLRRVRDETLKRYEMDSRLHTARRINVETPANWTTRIFPNSKPDAVLFDWDSVFTDHVPAYVAAVNAATSCIQEKYGVRPQRTQIRVTDVNTDPKRYIDELYIYQDIPEMDDPDDKNVPPGKLTVEEIATRAYAIMEKNLAEYKLHNTTMIPGWQQTLQLLKEKEIPYAIVSNGKAESIRKFIDMQMSPEEAALFDNVEILGESGKPDPGNIKQVLEHMGIKASKNVLFVGDTFNTDVKAALQAEVFPVLFGSRDLSVSGRNTTHMDDLRGSNELLHMVRKVKVPQWSKDEGKAIEAEQDEPLEIGFAANHAELQIMIAGVRERFRGDENAYRKFVDELTEFDRGNPEQKLPPKLPPR